MAPKLCMHAMKATTEQMGWQWKQLLASIVEHGIWNQHHVSVSEISTLFGVNSGQLCIQRYLIDY